MKLKKTLATLTLGVGGISMLLGNAFAAAPVDVFNLGQMKKIDGEVVAATNALHKAKVTRLTVENTNFYVGSKRWEAALLTKRFAQTFKKTKTQKVNSCVFRDISSTGMETAKEIIQSCRIGLFKGHDGKFGPHDTFTRGQAIMVFARMLSNDPTLELDASYNYLLQNGIIHVDDRANSSRAVPRSELYLMMYRMIEKVSKNPELAKKSGFDINLIKQVYDSVDLNESNGQVTPPKNEKPTETTITTVTKEEEKKILEMSGTDLNIVASTKDNKVQDSDAVPTGTTRLILSKAILKNNTNEDISIKDISFDLNGLVSTKAIERVYVLSEDGVALNSASMKNNKTTTVYPKPYYAKIPAGKTVNLYIAVDTLKDESISGQIFKLSYTFNFEKDLKIGGSRTGETKEKRFVAYEVQTAVVEGYDTPASKIYVGETNKLIGSFQVTAGQKSSNSRKDIFLERVILTNEDGRLEDKIKNVVFKVGDKVISNDVTVNRNTITASFKKLEEQKDAKDEMIDKVKSGSTSVEKSDRYDVERGDTLIVDVYADVVDGSNGDRIALTLKNNGDIQAKEHGTNVPVNIRLESPRVFKQFEILAGKIVLSKASDSPIIDTLPVNSSPTNVLTFQVSSPSELNLEALKLKGKLRNNSGERVDAYDVFKSVKIYKCEGKDSCRFVEEASIPRVAVNNGATSAFEVRTSVFNIAKGTTTYQIKVETDRFAPKLVDFSFEVDRDSFVDVTNAQDERINLASIVGAASSNFWTIGSNTLTLSYVNNETLDYVKGKADSYLGDIYITAPATPNLKLNSLRIKFQSSDNDLNWEQLMNVQLKNGKVRVGDPRNVDSNGYVTFDNLNLKVDNGSVRLALYADIAQNFYTNPTAVKTFRWSIESNNTRDIIMTSGKGTTVNKNDINGLPITSQDVGVYPTGKAYIFKDGDQPEGKILFNNDGKFQDVLKYKIRTQYDDVRVKDVYVVAWKGAYSKDAGNASNIETNASNAISQIRYKGGKTVDASVVNGIARFTNLNDNITANKEQSISIALQVSNIHNIAADNQEIQMAVVLKLEDASGQRYETKLISLANGNIIDTTNIDFNDELISNKQVLRKTMIEVNSQTNELSKNILNGGEHSLYQLNIKNVGRSRAKVKQIALPFTINNGGSDLALNNFKLEVSTNGGRSFRNWSEFKNNVQMAVVPAGTALQASDWKSADAVTLTESANKNYVLYARFVGSYVNGFDVSAGETIALRVKANVSGADNNTDAIAFEAKAYSSATDGKMNAYSTYEQGTEAENTIIWSDNADADGHSSITDANWFEDYGVEGKYQTHSVNYKS